MQLQWKPSDLTAATQVEWKKEEPLLEGEGVTFLGEVNEQQKSALLGGARAMLFPIDWPEPFGLVMIEAMACGTPTIACNRGSVPEIIEDGVSGFVVQDIDQAVNAVHRIGEIDRRRCRERFEARFTAKRMAAEYLESYRQRARGLFDRSDAEIVGASHGSD